MQNSPFWFVFALSLIVCACTAPVSSGQVPASADSLADWDEDTVQTYVDSSAQDTIHVVYPDTWVARLYDNIEDPPKTVVGCELGPNGSPWVYEPYTLLDRYISGADTTLTHDNFQAAAECFWDVQTLWRHKEGLLQ